MLKTHIINAYGEAIYKQTTKLQLMKKQAATAKCRWIFMSRCITNDVLPKSFRTKSVLKSKKAYTLTKEHNNRMLKLTRDSAKKQYYNHLNNIEATAENLYTQLTTTDFGTIWHVTEQSRENKFLKERTRLKKKFEDLHQDDTHTTQ